MTVTKSVGGGDRAPVVILAHGWGSRLARVAGGPHKTTERVLGRPVLAWLLEEIAATGLAGATVVTVRTDDPDVAGAVAASPLQVQVQHRQPRGYLPDVYDLSRTCGRRFTVVEGDTVPYPGMLRNFVLLAEQLGPAADLCVGVGPRSANPNGPAIVLGEDGRIAAMRWNVEPTGLVPLGAWHWTARLLEDAPTFQSTSTADYVTWAAPRGATILPIGMPAGFNINTPENLDLARRGVPRWFGSHLTQQTTTPPQRREEETLWQSQS
jgi:choline kinase